MSEKFSLFGFGKKREKPNTELQREVNEVQESLPSSQLKALEQLDIEEVHWQVADRARKAELEIGSTWIKEADNRNKVYREDLHALRRATNMYRDARLLGRELSTPITDAEINVLCADAKLTLTPCVQEVEKFDNSDSGVPTYVEELTVPNAAEGFSSLELLIDSGVSREKLPEITDETFHLIEKSIEERNTSEYFNYLDNSDLRTLAAMKKVSSEHFTVLKNKFGKEWESKVIEALPTDENKSPKFKYHLYQKDDSAQLLIDILDVFADSTEIRQVVRSAILFEEQEGLSRSSSHPNGEAQEILDKIKNSNSDNDWSKNSFTIRVPLRTAYLRKALAEKLREV